MKLLIYPAIDNVRYSALCDVDSRLTIVNAADAEQAEREIVDAEGFFGKMTPALLARAEVLRWIQSPTASLEHYLFPELIDHPCALSNMRGLFSDVIADHVMGYVISFARQFPLYFRQQLCANWEPAGGEAARTDNKCGPGMITDMDRAHRHLADDTLGIVGVGEIGAEIARRAKAFGLNLIGIDPVRRTLPGIIDDIGDVSQLPELLAASDYVVIAAPHTPETFKMFRRKQFEQMRSTAYLINIGRGVIVDLADLTAALQQKQIAGAGFDVFEVEPLPSDHPLWAMENVIITPHVAAASPRIAERHFAVVKENVGRFASGELLTNLVDKRRWY
ncbi:MAG: D-2-hydroxyacid dehydrogenase [Planctomycetota bacterium]|nr:D-2-hydroxyacid dehydrogenase [Planctomycetota bacterium]MDA1211040.1 D-2-hydroxyacid dehydrogenase [Planctomycetota bacterium]